VQVLDDVYTLQTLPPKVYHHHIGVKVLGQREGFLDTAGLTYDGHIWLDGQAHPQPLAYLDLSVN
jgi:hypothetical protein